MSSQSFDCTHCFVMLAVRIISQRTVFCLTLRNSRSRACEFAIAGREVCAPARERANRIRIRCLQLILFEIDLCMRECSAE